MLQNDAITTDQSLAGLTKIFIIVKCTKHWLVCVVSLKNSFLRRHFTDIYQLMVECFAACLMVLLAYSAEEFTAVAAEADSWAIS